MAGMEDAKPDTTRQRKTKRPRRWLRRLLLLSLLLAIAVGALWILPADLELSANGNIYTDNSATLRASVKGPVARVLVTTAQHVSAGDVIVELEDAQQQAELRRVQCLLAEARQELERLTRALDVERAEDKARIDEAKVVKASAKDELDSVAGMRKKGIASEQEYQRAKLAHDLTAARLQAAAIEREPLRLAQLAVQRKRIETLQAELESSRQQIRLRKIFSPIDGRVYLHELAIGQVVDANRIVGQVFDERRFVIKAALPERDYWFLKQGQAVKVETSAYPQSRFGYLAGRIEWVSHVVNPQASGDGRVTICVSLETPARADVVLKPGMNGRIWVHAGRTRLLWRLLPIRTFHRLDTQ